MNEGPLYNFPLLMLNVGFASHFGDWNWRNVRSPFARLYYVVDGEAQVELPDGIVSLLPHHLYLVPPYTMHSNICKGGFSHYYLHLYEDPSYGGCFWDDWKFPVEVEAANDDQNLMKRLCEVNPGMRLSQSDPESYDNRTTLISNIQNNQQRSVCDKVESTGIILLLLSRFLRHATAEKRVKDERIEQSLTYIRENIGRRVNMDELAKVACMSKDHFIRMFKREVSHTPNAYVTEKKIERAELLLVTTLLPVKQIALSLGYDDMAYFNNVFKRHTKVSPLQYREKYSQV
ncbi:MAG: AraC family transcriptional regulator [Prevotella sp.]|nr:AraC family transcriptional regulator [Prevotella sp.]